MIDINEGAKLWQASNMQIDEMEAAEGKIPAQAVKVTCLICTNALDKPYRVYGADGKVIGGCVSKAHTGHLVPMSESSFWHNSKNAKQIRAKYKL